jgi:hypothetical protein
MEIFADLLKAYAWPIFFGIIIYTFYAHILSCFKFLGDLIKSRGLRVKYGDSETQIPPDDPNSTKQKEAKRVKEEAFLPSSSSPSSSSSSSTTTTTAPPIFHQIYNNAESESSIKMGFGVIKKDGFEIINQLHIKCDPEIKNVSGNEYNIGQKVYFAIQNILDNEICTPLCRIQFPSKFKHLSTEHPETGMMTINSALWGIGGVSTELVDLNLEISELSGLLGRSLKPGQIARFFIRLKIPETIECFDVIMKLESENHYKIERKLSLMTNQ